MKSEFVYIAITRLCLQLKELSHDNIESFIGACVEPEHICYLMQSCSHGTLQVGWTLFTWLSRSVEKFFYTVKPTVALYFEIFAELSTSRLVIIIVMVA